jgi:dihydrofolate reductase
MFMSLDGVIEEPMWSLQYWDDAIAQFKRSELFNSGALLLGRKTYEGFVQAWPARQGTDDYADRINGLPKYVVTSTLKTPEWNATFIQGDIAAEIAKLKQQSQQDLLLFGSGQLVQLLVQHDLVDEYRLLLYPLALGQGQRLFEEGTNTKLKLVECKPYSKGAVSLIYHLESKG